MGFSERDSWGARGGASPLPPPGEDDGPHSLREVGGLGESLGPALHDECGDKLGDIEWFSTPWQRSGASTGYTHWRLPDGSVIDGIVKVPVGYREWYWSTKLGETDPMWYRSPEAEHLPVPRVLASGTELGGYDVAWLVVERVAGSSLKSELESGVGPRAALERLFQAAARFHAAAGAVREPTDEDGPARRDWAGMIERSARAVRDNPVPEGQRWGGMIERVGASLDGLVSRWRSRPMRTWCHGDLHPGNVLTRPSGVAGARSGAGVAEDRQEAVLIDLGLVHAGYWVEDALYLERLFWGRTELLGGADPVTLLGEARSGIGLEGDVTAASAMAEVRRVLMAATSPAFLSQEGDPAYLGSALDRLERDAASGLF